MPRYYFRISNGQESLDNPKGMDLPGNAAAREQAVVLAGGLGTRMRPHSERVPKSLIEVAGRPFIDWQLELLAGSGIREVVLCIAHLGQEIGRAHV